MTMLSVCSSVDPQEIAAKSFERTGENIRRNAELITFALILMLRDAVPYSVRLWIEKQITLEFFELFDIFSEFHN